VIYPSSREHEDPTTGRAFYEGVIAAKKEIDTETRFSMDDSRALFFCFVAGLQNRLVLT
jgi:hypothetical protein